jgi:hypothetical protein
MNDDACAAAPLTSSNESLSAIVADARNGYVPTQVHAKAPGRFRTPEMVPRPGRPPRARPRDAAHAQANSAQTKKYAAVTGNIVMVGFGSIGQVGRVRRVPCGCSRWTGEFSQRGGVATLRPPPVAARDAFSSLSSMLSVRNWRPRRALCELSAGGAWVGNGGILQRRTKSQRGAGHAAAHPAPHRVP